MKTEARIDLINYWGREIVVKCCRYWKLHFADGRWGNCGICKQRPQLTNFTWDEIANESN